MSAKFDYVDGKLVRFVQEDINDESAIEAEIQADLDAKQDLVNMATAEQANAETEYTAAEAAAEAASLKLDQTKAAKEAAEADLTKSVDSKTSYVAALELRNNQSVPEEPDSASEGAEGESETTDISDRITAVVAEG